MSTFPLSRCSQFVKSSTLFPAIHDHTHMQSSTPMTKNLCPRVCVCVCFPDRIKGVCNAYLRLPAKSVQQLASFSTCTYSAVYFHLLPTRIGQEIIELASYMRIAGRHSAACSSMHVFCRIGSSPPNTDRLGSNLASSVRAYSQKALGCVVPTLLDLASKR